MEYAAAGNNSLKKKLQRVEVLPASRSPCLTEFRVMHSFSLSLSLIGVAALFYIGSGAGSFCLCSRAQPDSTRLGMSKNRIPYNRSTTFRIASQREALSCIRSWAGESFSMGGFLRICCNSQSEGIREIWGRRWLSLKPASRKQSYAKLMRKSGSG